MQSLTSCAGPRAPANFRVYQCLYVSTMLRFALRSTYVLLVKYLLYKHLTQPNPHNHV